VRNFFCFFCFPVSSVACVLSLHRTAKMSRSVVAVARLLGRSRLAAPTCSVPSLNFGIGGIVADDGSVLCERHTIMNGGGALSGGQAAWGSIHQVPSRAFSDDHTAKWMQSTDKKSPMELISEVPVIEVDARVVACEGGRDPALGHPIEYICLDGDHPAVCKYCGLRYSLRDAHGHH
jgi:NADH dehydrogenase (ubiquinone) Fe-S protein 6